jgi:hypothetical protein
MTIVDRSGIGLTVPEFSLTKENDEKFIHAGLYPGLHSTHGKRYYSHWKIENEIKKKNTKMISGTEYCATLGSPLTSYPEARRTKFRPYIDDPSRFVRFLYVPSEKLRERTQIMLRPLSFHNRSTYLLTNLLPAQRYTGWASLHNLYDKEICHRTEVSATGSR